jgi:hypothetical protein
MRTSVSRIFNSSAVATLIFSLTCSRRRDALPHSRRSMMAEWIFCTGKGRGKVYRRTGHEGPEEEWRYSCTLHLTWALDGGAWSTPRPGRFLGRPGAQYTGAGWAPGSVWTGAETLARTGIRSSAHGESYRLRYSVGPYMGSDNGFNATVWTTNPGCILDKERDSCLAQQSKSRLGPPSLLFSAYRLLCPHEWCGRSAKLTFPSSIVIRLDGATAALCCCTLEGEGVVSFTPGVRAVVPIA